MPGQYFPIDWPKPEPKTRPNTSPLESVLSQPRTTRYGGEHPGNYENTVLKRWREEEALEEERLWQEKILEKELASQEAAQETELANALAQARMNKELGMAQLGTQERMNTEQLNAAQPQGPSAKEQAGTAYEFLRSLESPEDRQVFLQALKDKEGESGGHCFKRD